MSDEDLAELAEIRKTITEKSFFYRPLTPEQVDNMALRTLMLRRSLGWDADTTLSIVRKRDVPGLVDLLTEARGYLFCLATPGKATPQPQCGCSTCSLTRKIQTVLAFFGTSRKNHER